MRGSKMETGADLAAEIAACGHCAPRFAATVSGHAPRPVVWFRSTARLLIAGQAPGVRVHRSGVPFDDASGARLRGWLGLEPAAFYDRERVAIVPMAFCFPGHDARRGDLPPPPDCARLWHGRVMAALPAVRLVLALGAAAQRWHMGPGGSVDARVRDWRAHVTGIGAGPRILPLPHPSWRNTGWLRRNPWFEDELLPRLREEVKEVLA